jgi:hypothetical protein
MYESFSCFAFLLAFGIVYFVSVNHSNSCVSSIYFIVVLVCIYQVTNYHPCSIISEMSVNNFLYYYYYLAVLGFELRALFLPGRCTITWTTPPALFALDIFRILSRIYAWTGLDHDPPNYTSSKAGMTGVYHHTLKAVPHPAFYRLRWSLVDFLPGLALNSNPPDLCLPSS